MAYIIGEDYDAKFIDTGVVFSDGDAALKAFFAKTYIAPNSIIKASWVTGNAIPPEVVPTKARIVEGGPLYDWRTVRGGTTLVSDRFKACVEALDPGRHGFFPLTVEDLNGDVMPGPYVLFNVVGRIDSIIEAQSNLKASGRGFIDGWEYERPTGPWKCALDAAVIGDRACWTEIRYGRRWFISDRLATLLRARGLEGFDYTLACEEIPAGA
ncbi:MAG TPA: DUF1629 domain-containing protein [Rhizomicrobium sp.]|jgi:hypothetical protein|nr:DUF1629 domain-containing protein [Rhizomicrobium sp.]